MVFTIMILLRLKIAQNVLAREVDLLCVGDSYRKNQQRRQ